MQQSETPWSSWATRWISLKRWRFPKTFDVGPDFVVHWIVGSHRKSLSELLVQPQSQFPPVLVSQPVWTADFQLLTSRSPDSRNAVVLATCSSFAQVPQLSLRFLYRWSRDLQLFRFVSLRRIQRLYCEMLQHRLGQVPICHQFLRTEEYRTLPDQCTAANQVPPINLGLRTVALRCREVCYWHANSAPSQNSHSRFVRHRATQQKLEGEESKKTQLWTLKELPQLWRLSERNTDWNMEKSHHHFLDSLPQSFNRKKNWQS